MQAQEIVAYRKEMAWEEYLMPGSLAEALEMLERYRGAAYVWVFLFWPIWMFLATAGGVAWFVLAEPPSPWYALCFGLGAVPALGQAVIVGRCNTIRRYLGDAIVGIVEELRTSLLV